MPWETSFKNIKKYCQTPTSLKSSVYFPFIMIFKKPLPPIVFQMSYFFIKHSSMYFLCPFSALSVMDQDICVICYGPGRDQQRYKQPLLWATKGSAAALTKGQCFTASQTRAVDDFKLQLVTSGNTGSNKNQGKNKINSIRSNSVLRPHTHINFSR